MLKSNLTKIFIKKPLVLLWGFFVFSFSLLAQDKTDSFKQYVARESNKVFSALLIDTIGAGGIDILISCYDTASNQIWSKTYGGANTELVSGILLHDSLLVVYGVTRSSSIGINDNFILILNKDGEFIDDIIFGSSDSETAKDMLMVNNIIYFLGASNNATIINKIEFSNHSLFLLETLKITSVEEQRAEFFTLNSKKELIITGNLSYNSSLQKDIFYLKLDSNYNVLTSKKYGDTTEIQLSKCVKDENDNIYAVGFSYLGDVMNSFVVKIDSSGSLIFNKSYGTFLIEKAYEVQVFDNKLYVGGYTQSTTGTYDDGFLLKLDGNLTLNNAVRFNLSNDEYVTQINFDDDFILLSGPLKSTSVVSWRFFSIEIDTSFNSCDAANWQVDVFQNEISTQDFNITFDSLSFLIDTVTMLYQNSNVEIEPYFCNLDRTDSIRDSTKVGLNSQKQDILIYPNPAKNVLNIKNNVELIKSVQIYDLSGALVLISDDVFKNEIELKIDDLKEGVYFVKIVEKNLSSIHKFLVY